MSYLNRLRLHFAGKFQASVSTVNNDPTHFNNATFKPSDQERGPDGTNGWWNPRGDAAWRLIGVKVTSAFHADGSSVQASDAILTCLIADSDRSVSAKMADLDPQQQMVSGIWGLEVRIVDQTGATLLRGQFEPASFMDIWARATEGQGDLTACAAYQSIVTKLEWGDLSRSAFLQELRKVSPDRLSMKFNVDGYNMDFKSPDFTKGRIVGSIGPSSAAEPVHFVNGRQLMAEGKPTVSFFEPAGGINFCPAVVDEQAGKILIDLGNAMPTTTAGGPSQDIGALSMVCQILNPNNPTTPPNDLPIGDISYLADGWYEQTAGVVELPSDRSLTAQELEQIRSNPLALLTTQPGQQPVAAITERMDGYYVRADQFVYRMNPGDKASVTVYATHFGQAYTNANVLLLNDPSQLQGGPGEPPVATPVEALKYPLLVVTGADGTATFDLHGFDPKNPRGYIDGQVYGIRPILEDMIVPPGNDYPINAANFISVLLWNDFKPDEPITWHGSIEPIFQQYANLYPVMDRFMNLGDYEQVCNNRQLLLLAFSLDPTNPNAMPVTRDLSSAKHEAIHRWLLHVGPDGKPLLGEKQKPRVEHTDEHAAPEIPQELTDPRGGKTAALRRRLVHQTSTARKKHQQRQH